MMGHATFKASSVDPRVALGEAQQQSLALRTMLPAVATPRRASDGIGLALGVLGALGLGALTLLGLSGQRGHAAAPPITATPLPAASAAKPTPAIASAAAQNMPVAAPNAVKVVIDPNAPDPGQSRGMPMIYDSTGIESAAGATTAATDASAPGGDRNGLSSDELFAVRAMGDAPPLAEARGLADGRNTVVQGTILPAVLETAVNSDLPGYTRAIISRDVRGFDGTAVLIPRGSRLVGQYKSGLAAGQSRAYIMWTRLIRPDGVSVQLGSPAMDETGEVGLPGEVKRHFWQRFGASMLLSVVSGLASSIGDGNSVVVAGSGAGSAAGVALETDGKIPPTIRIPQGAPIQVFVARDLDFSGFATRTGANTPRASSSTPIIPTEVLQ